MCRMKKRFLFLLCVLALVLALAGCVNKGETPAAGGNDGGNTPASGGNTPAAGTDTANTEGIQASPEFYATADLSVLSGKKIGVTIQSLQNVYWAGVMAALEETLQANGANVTIVACDDSSATQIGQVENFVSSGCGSIPLTPPPSRTSAPRPGARTSRSCAGTTP